MQCSSSSVVQNMAGMKKMFRKPGSDSSERSLLNRDDNIELRQDNYGAVKTQDVAVLMNSDGGVCGRLAPEEYTIPGGRDGVHSNAFYRGKIFTQSLMDIALLSVNAIQLRYLLDCGRMHPYFYIGLVLLLISFCLQVAVGIALILNHRDSYRHEDVVKANKIDKCILVCIFMIIVVNVIFSAFSAIQNSCDLHLCKITNMIEPIALNCSQCH